MINCFYRLVIWVVRKTLHFHSTFPKSDCQHKGRCWTLFSNLSYLAVPTLVFMKQKGYHPSFSLQVYFNPFSSMMEAFEFPVSYSNGKTKSFELQQFEELTFSFCILDSNWQLLGDVALINYPSLVNKEPAFSSPKIRKDINSCIFIIKLAHRQRKHNPGQQTGQSKDKTIIKWINKHLQNFNRKYIFP